MMTSFHTTTPSEEQSRAIEHTEGPCIVLAGPGSGKTYVLTRRIALLLEKPTVNPWNILALTFTNKAAREMTSRIEQLVGDPAKNLWIGTFHSLFARMLRIEAENIKLLRNFTIYDGEDSKKLIKKILKELSLSEDIYKPNTVLRRISGAKNRLLIDAKEYAEHAACQAEDAEKGKKHMAQIFTHYQARCHQANALDFDDLLLYTYQMLRDHPHIAAKYQSRFQYILVDEFQDTNKLQYALIKKLAEKHQNLCVIGDDAQSIYAFRGADLTHMLNFQKDFPNSKEIKLAHNFRSTKHIVKAANALIRHNTKQLKKVLFTNNPAGEPLQLIDHRDNFGESIHVAQSIFETSQRSQTPYNQFAVLYRTHQQSRLIEESLRKLGIPYILRGGTSFYARKEIKDLLAYLRLLVNPNDEQALERVINTPRRGIGPATLPKVHTFALEQNIPLWQALEQNHQIFHATKAAVIEKFVQLINTYRQKMDTQDAYTIAKELAEASGLLKSLYDEKSIQELTQYENVQELLTSISDFVQRGEGEDQTIARYLQEVALMTGDEKNKDEPSVTLMTIHAAKGLEYDYIYIVGVNEDILPSTLMSDSRKGIEEERRLLYVGITRARLRVVLSYTVFRKHFDKYKHVDPSRFLQEIDPSLFSQTQSLQKNQQRNYHTYSYDTSKRALSSQHIPSAPPHTKFIPLKKKKTHTANPSQGRSQHLKVGTRVKHPQFGEGVILRINHTTHGERIEVEFTHVGTKTLLVSFAKLTIL